MKAVKTIQIYYNVDMSGTDWAMFRYIIYIPKTNKIVNSHSESSYNIKRHASYK